MQYNLTVNWDEYEGNVRAIRPAELIAMCDCRPANIGYFGIANVRRAVAPSQDKAYPMVPTATTDGETCDHCGNYCYMGTEETLQIATRNKRGAQSRQMASGE